MLDIGVGIALEHLGFQHRTLVYCEREAYAQAVLLARMEETTLERAAICDSLEDIDGRWRGKVSGIVAGFPCQPFSLAGSRKGTGDERWLVTILSGRAYDNNNAIVQSGTAQRVGNEAPIDPLDCAPISRVRRNNAVDHLGEAPVE